MYVWHCERARCTLYAPLDLARSGNLLVVLATWLSWAPCCAVAQPPRAGRSHGFSHAFSHKDPDPRTLPAQAHRRLRRGVPALRQASCCWCRPFGGASRTPVAEGGGALWPARRSISPREKNGEKRSVGSVPRRGSALGANLQVAIVVVRERSHLERVGDRCGSLAIRLSQRNSTHMLGASPFTA